MRVSSFLARCLLLWLDLRMFLWRWLHVPMPARTDWKKFVYEVARCDGVWHSEDGREHGAPFAWSLLYRDADGVVQQIDTHCVESGVAINPRTPVVDGRFDLTHFGVRCARCGLPVHVHHAGLRVTSDVPSCRRCRRSVKQAIQEAT